jgi:threonine/homoserine/homoserine lactone efflux protein
MLIGPDQAVGFLAAAAVITLAPGPDILMVLSLGAARGPRAGIVFGLGCACGCLSHTVLAALGVSVLIAASPWAFGVLRLCGGGYLIWLGLKALSTPAGAPAGVAGAITGPVAALFRRGLVANALNPKVILFFLAFLPQFVSPSRGTPGLQMAQFGVLFTLQAAALFALTGAAAGRVGTWLGRRPGFGRWLDRGTGVLFVGLGLKLILVP